jgi:hypothetical protein
VKTGRPNPIPLQLQITRNTVRTLLCIIFLFSGGRQIRAGAAAGQEVQLSALAQASPPLIAISWPASSNALRYVVYRKTSDASSWGSSVVTLGAAATTYTDTNVLQGVSYVYRVSKADNGHGGEGYINCGIPVSPVETRGKAPYIGDNTSPPNQFSSGGCGAGPGGSGGSPGGGAGPAGQVWESGTNIGNPGLILTFYPAGNQDLAGSPVETGFAPESGAFATAASVCAFLSLLGFCKRQKRR